MNLKIFFIKSFILLFLLLTLQGEHNLFSQVKNTQNSDSLSDSVQLKLHSPVKASLYSAILPGLGQLYNKKYWKIPVVYAGFGTLGYFISYNQSGFTKYRKAYIDYTDGLPETQSYLELVAETLDPDSFDAQEAEWFTDLLKDNMDYYRRNRDLSYIGLVGWYLLNIVDATVDAHLFDYDIGDELSLKIEPDLMYAGRNFNALGLKVKFAF